MSQLILCLHTAEPKKVLLLVHLHQSVLMSDLNSYFDFLNDAQCFEHTEGGIASDARASFVSLSHDEHVSGADTGGARGARTSPPF